MRLEGRRVSENVEDRRRSKAPAVAAGGGAIVLVIYLIATFLGVDPKPLVNQIGAQQQRAVEQAPAGQERQLTPEEEAQGKEAAQILALTEDVWKDLWTRSPILQQHGDRYQPPKMVLFSGQTRSGCGFASSATGPFYCPADSKVYLDTSFFTELEKRFGAKGDFARAYVIAHEVGHHIQHLMGTTDKVDAQRGKISEVEMNRLSVRLELQADYLAGVFANMLQGDERILEKDDIDEAIMCAQAIGDDRLQEMSRGKGNVVPDSFTHGTSDQRIRWFLNGFTSGDLQGADTFKVPYDQL